MDGVRTTLARLRPLIRRQGGFTLVELLMVIVMLGFTMIAFESDVQHGRQPQLAGGEPEHPPDRGAADPEPARLRPARRRPGQRHDPDHSYSANSITFYSPDRQSPPHMRRIKYYVDGLGMLKRQVTISTNTNGPPWTGIDTDTGPIETLFGTIRNPTSIFKYCVQSPPDMTIDPNNATSPDLITWSCQAPTTAAQIKTVVIRTVVSTLTDSQQYNYGAVATIRWNRHEQAEETHRPRGRDRDGDRVSP